MIKRALFLFLLLLMAFSLEAQTITTQTVRVCDSVSIPSELSAYINRYKDSVNMVMNEVIATSSVEYNKASADNNLQRITGMALKCAAARLTGKEPDAAMCNNGGLRNVLPKGPITLGDVYAVFPFENNLAVLVVDGKTLLRFQEISQRGKKVFLSLPEFINPKSEYTIVTIDYLADGNDGLSPVVKRSRRDYPVLLRDVMIDYVSKAKDL